jgi:tRNA G18 (ribose-2'-O)-methylase SpoU
MNVIDALKDLSIDTIKTYCQDNAISADVAMINIGGDFNLSTMVRNANFFGFKSVHYVGKKKWDKRGSVGTYHYTPMYNYNTEESFISHFTNRTIIAIENNIPEFADKTIELFDYNFSGIIDPIFVFGEEKRGLSHYILDRADIILTIKNHGSVRSLNVGTTSGIVMSYYRSILSQRK